MRAFVFLLFLLSGVCGLIYEVVWSRMLTEIFGSTVLAVGTILAAFMSGLALGGYLLGKRGDASANPLRLYSLYELGIGASAWIATLLMDRITPFYVWLDRSLGGSELLLGGIRFLLAFAVILVPTVLMGATLPILARFVITRLSSVGNHLSSLYAINIVGAVGGSLLSGFFLINILGVHRSVLVAVFGNLAIGLAAWFASGRRRDDSPEVTESPVRASVAPAGEEGRLSPATRRLLFWAFGLSGLASFAYEIFWTRSLVHLLGNSTYSFTMMLVAFLSGLALGGYLVRFALGRIRNGLKWFGWLEILIGLSAVIAMPVLFTSVESDAFKSFLSRMSNDLGFLMASQFVVAIAVMLIPATLIGATFPLVGSIFVRDLRQTGEDVGKVYAVNTLGNVVGALAPALVLLPVYGIQKGVALMAALNVTLGTFLLLSQSARWAKLRWVPPLAFLLAAMVLPRISVGFQFPSQDQRPEDRVLYYREGLAGTTKVFENPDTGHKKMSIDGITIGGTEFTDYKQQILAHFPKLLVQGYRSELSIGLGSGILIGESLQHSQLERLVCLEIEPTVLEGAELFAEENYHVLEDRRLEIVLDDVGNYLRTTSELFDLVSADEKTADKYASNGFSYSADYYALLRERLSPGGLVMQWIPNHLPSSQYRMVLKTFTEAFPEVTVWYFPAVGKGGPTNTIVTGSLAAPIIDPGWMNETLQRDRTAFRGWQKYGIETAESLLAHYVSDGAAVLDATADAKSNSLEFPYYEFYSPREYSSSINDRTLENHHLLWDLRSRHGWMELPGRLRGAVPELAATAFMAEDEFLRGLRAQLEARPHLEIAQHLDRSLGLAPWNRNLRAQILTYLWSVAGNLYLQGNCLDGLYFMDQAATVFPESGEVRYYHGLLLLQNGKIDEAVREMEAAIKLHPRLLIPRRRLVSIYFETGAYDAAWEQVDAILAIDPTDEFVLNLLGER